MNMKTRSVLACFCLIITGLPEANAQSLRGKVIYVSQSQEVMIRFGSAIENYSFVNKEESQNFNVRLIKSRTFVVKGVQENLKSSNLVITENANTHLFILVFKDKLSNNELAYDFSTKEKLLSEIKKIPSSADGTNKNNYVKNIPAQTSNAIETPKAEVDSAQKQLDTRHAQLVARADTLFQEEDYDEAKRLYTAALDLKPDDSLCISQLKVIELTADLQKLKEQETTDPIANTQPVQPVTVAPEQKQLDDKYADLIARGWQAYVKANYDEANGLYTAALLLKPNDSLSISQLKLIQIVRDSIKFEEQQAKLEEEKAAADKLAKQKAAAEAEKAELDKKYTDLITLANRSYKNANYDEAIGLYSAALVLKPTDNWCVVQIGKVRNSKDSLQLQQQRTADQLRMAMKEKALAEQKALAERKALAEQKTLDNKYTDLVALANKAYASRNYDESIGLYKAALLLKPNDSWCTGQLNVAQAARTRAQQKTLQAEHSSQGTMKVTAASMEKQPDVINNTNTRFADLISSANKAYVARKYDDATELYSAALKLKPNDSWCVSQLKSIQTLTDLHEQKSLTTKHTTLTVRANKAYVARKYDEANQLYIEALKLIPDDPWCISQLKTIQNTTGVINRNNRERVEELEAAMKVHTKQGQKQPARKFMELVALANNAFVIRKYEVAHDLYSVALRLQPNDDWCMAQLNIIKSVKDPSKPKITRRQMAPAP